VSFRIREGEPLASELRRIVAAEIDRCLDAAADETVDGSVHEVRRRIKKIRAVLKLARGALGHDTFRAEDVFYRDLGRALNDARDATVLIGIVDSLEGEGGERLQDTLSELRGRLVERKGKVGERFAGSGTLEELARELRAAKARLDDRELSGEGFDLIRSGLQRSYGKARTGFLRVRRGGGRTELYHEWRKRTKDVRHQVEMLERSWPALLGAQAEELHRLSDLLGEANDLSVLVDTLDSEPELVPGPAAVEAIRKTVGGLQGRLWAEALPLGERVYAEPPALFVRRMASYWSAPWSAA